MVRYAILLVDNTIGDFLETSLDLEDIVVPEFQDMYIVVPTESTLKIGDIWNPESKTWTIVNVEVHPDPVVEYVPTNTEIAQMISDLQADLIIAGVI